ncbi:MAG: hypothetical protein H7Z41_05220 [Cytophagales bacterium]|nr:hypothetical protein [Armatimonadota bacterium]
MPISNGRPHKRVLLTQPSIAEEMSSAPLPGGGPETNSSLVRVIAYLTPEEAQELEMVWLQMRALSIRPSKADIMRAALKMALENTDALSSKLAEQVGGGAPAAAGSRKVPAKV